MKLFVIALAFALSACHASSPPPTTPATTPPATAPAHASTPDRSAMTGGACGASGECPAPSKCIDVVGMRPESARKECWVGCEKEGSDDGCPSGMTCTFIHDGAGRVCVAKQ